MTTRTQTQYKIVLHWLDGKTETLTGWGDSERGAAADAMNTAGYGGGAVRALDYFEASVHE